MESSAAIAIVQVAFRMASVSNFRPLSQASSLNGVTIPAGRNKKKLFKAWINPIR